MSIPETTPFTPEQRRALLDEFFLLYKRYTDGWTLMSEMRAQYPLEDEAAFNALAEASRASDARMKEIVQIYKNQVPVVPLSRCPFCQAINYHSFDFYDLDGLWWATGAHDWRRIVESNVYRPRERHRLCPHFWSLSGAVALRGEPSSSPLSVSPGPEVPFVFTHTLNFPAIKVVISQFNVGSHIAYPLVYFSEVKPVPWDDVRPQFKEWSNTIAITFDEKDGSPNPNLENIEYPMVYLNYPPYDRAADDFDLAPWIKQGRVLWIAPGDETLTLKQQVEGCPYLDLPGRRDRVQVLNGQIYPATSPRKI
ncbi:hypothetical protein ACQ4M4_22455 [Leptolyngbya sp. AN02str]|uniref:hypothetical protein n=1 Tax=Leptolyngbya sp. AN02str TaxID=3423363 RepID=UPI003D31DED9